MNRFILGVGAIVLAVASVAGALWHHHHGEPPYVTVPPEVSTPPGRMARIVCSTNSKQVKYVNVHAGADIFREYDPSQFIFVFLADKEGSYKLGFYTAAGDVPSDCSYCNVVVGTPKPPVPPEPPIPPEPPPSPAPLAFDGLAVLIVYESKTASELPPNQHSALFGKTVRDYLRANCVKDATAEQDGKAYRIWDPDVDTSSASDAWKTAMKRPRKEVPWIIVSNPKKGGGFEGPAPKTVDDMLSLLKKYEG